VEGNAYSLATNIWT